jgi:outer membrane receptor protein involved in Fe transport
LETPRLLAQAFMQYRILSFNFPLIASIGLRYDYTKLDSLDASGAISPKLGLNYKLSNNLDNSVLL